MEDYRGDQYGEYNRRAWQGYSSDSEGQQPDLSAVAVIALASGIASFIGLVIVWLTRLGQPKEEKKLEQIIEAATAGKLDEWAGKGSSKKAARALLRTRDRAAEVATTVGDQAGELGKEAGKRAAELGKEAEKRTRGLRKEAGKRAEQLGSDVSDRAGELADQAPHMLETVRGRVGEALGAVGAAAAPIVAEAGKRLGHTVDDLTSSRGAKKAGQQVEDIRDNLANLIDNIDLGQYQGKARKQAANLRKRAESLLASLEVEDRTKKASKVIQHQAQELGKAIDHADLPDQAGQLAARARDAITSVDLGQVLSDAGDAVTRKAKEIEKDTRGLRHDAGKSVEHATTEAGKLAKKAGEQSGSWLATITAALGSFVQDFTKKTIPELTQAASKAGEQIRGQVVLPTAERAGEIYQETAPRVGDAIGSAADYVRNEAIPNVADAAGTAAEYVQKEVAPRVADAASATADFVTSTALPAAGEFLSEAGDRVQKAYKDVAPQVGEALGNVGEAVGSAAQNVGEAVGGMFHQNGRHHNSGLLSNVGDAVGGAAQNVGDATGKALVTAGKATRKATDDTVSTIFWLTAAGAALVFLFAPEKEQRDQLWQNLQSLISQGRDLVQEFQGYGNELEA